MTMVIETLQRVQTPYANAVVPTPVFCKYPKWFFPSAHEWSIEYSTALLVEMAGLKPLEVDWVWGTGERRKEWRKRPTRKRLLQMQKEGW